MKPLVVDLVYLGGLIMGKLGLPGGAYGQYANATTRLVGTAKQHLVHIWVPTRFSHATVQLL